ncbi:MAG: DUF1493 family protein [Acaryochloridaceae cyanobacterium RL_2_7]|nr:DUF1493 family protein [Acaryochloridaceae cyanobacterium RL_2_7]
MLISFEEVADVVGEFVRSCKSYTITPNTRLEHDLGVTGDDGIELLVHVAETFHVELSDPDSGYQKAFALKSNEVLFQSEGIDFLGIGRLFQHLSHSPHYVIRDLTVGQLFEAVVRAQNPRDLDS